VDLAILTTAEAVLRAEQTGQPPRELTIAQAAPADHLAGIPRDIRYLAVSGRAPDLELLSEFTNIEILWTSRVDERALKKVGKVRSLRLLSLNATSVASLRALVGLEQLRHLLVCNAPRLESVEGLESLEALQTVLLWDLKRLTDLTSVGRLSQLRGLQCGGGMWTTLQLETLAPLAGLARLEYLDLPSARARDGSLAPLHGLQTLRQLALPNRYRIEEFAALAAALPETDGGCLRPHWPPTALPCKSCGTPRLLETGLRGRFVCPACDPERVRRRRLRFAALVNLARARRRTS
jgi:hypothetical protein